jgi:hypothetical protein
MRLLFARATSRPARTRRENANTLLLGDGGDYRVFENPTRIEILFGEAPITNSVGSQPI